MAFNGTEGSSIALDVAATFTAAYRAQLSTPGQVIGTFFGRDILNQILAQNGTMGIRFYFAIESGISTLVAVGADAAENDQISGVIAEFCSPCPPHCSTPNALNS